MKNMLMPGKPKVKKPKVKKSKIKKPVVKKQPKGDGTLPSWM